MKHALPILLLASLTGCFGSSTELVVSANSVPVPPALPQSLASACPTLSQIPDRSIGSLVLADANASLSYAACQSKHAEAVGLYSLWRQKTLDFIASLEKAP